MRIDATGFTAPATAFRLRSYQQDWINQVTEDRKVYSRLLIDACGGVGKSTVFAFLAKKEKEEKGGKTLVLENRNHIVEQSAKRLRDETGMEVDIEMGSQHASPYADVIVSSVQTLHRDSRLLSFAPDHFSLVVPDEAHFALADTWLKILHYFHYGAESLQEGWVKPKDGTYIPKAHIVGTTATSDLGDSRSLIGELFQKRSVRYTYRDAIRDGWLVPMKQTAIPIKIDANKFRMKRTALGNDFNAADESAALLPEIDKFADQIIELARGMKTMAFLPSVECADAMAESLNRKGRKSFIVTGSSFDADDNKICPIEETRKFMEASGDVVMCLCGMHIYGSDFPDVVCVAWLCATISACRYQQGHYRPVRPLPGLVNDDMTASQRRAAIAASAKPFAFALDPLFVHQRIDICSVEDLYTDNPAVKKIMKTIAGDPLEAAKTAEEQAERDALAALRKEMKLHEDKQPRTIDPVSYDVHLGEARLEGLVPKCDADLKPATLDELKLLLENQVDTSKVKTSGHAQELIGQLRKRDLQKLATPPQLQQLMLELNWPAEKAMLVSRKQAGLIIWKRFKYKPRQQEEQTPVQDFGDPFEL